MSYRIKTVADLTGIPRETILAWERRYGLIQPERASNGYRVYSDADVTVLREIKALVDDGLQISEAIALRDRVAEPEEAAVDLGADAGEDGPRRRLLAALCRFDRPGAELAHRAVTGLSFRERLDHVYSPLLQEVGDRWEAGELSVAQEHFATAFVREQVMSMLHAVALGPEGGRRAVCAGLPGEGHELGLLCTAARLALAGWRVTYLGAELPADELVSVVQSTRPALVCQSAVMMRWQNDALRYALALRKRLPDGTALVLGGPGVTGLDDSAVPGVMFCGTVDELLERVTSG